MNPFLDDDATTNVAGNSSTSRPRPRPRGEIARTHGLGSSWESGNSFEMLMTIGSGPNPYQPTCVPINRADRTAHDTWDVPTNQEVRNPVREDDSAFCEEQFRDIAGFTIKYSGTTYSPDFKVRPHGRNNALPVPRGSVLLGTSMKSHRAFYFDCKSVKWQTIKFHRSGTELFHFAYKPTFFGGRKSSRVSIFSPENHDRIGYVRIDEKLGKNAEIVDCINHVRFTTRPHFNELCTTIEIVDGEGNVAAIMNGSWGKLIGNETCYQISFSEDVVRKSGFTKAIFLTALAVLAIDSRERFIFEDFIILGLGTLILFFLLILVLSTSGGSGRI